MPNDETPAVPTPKGDSQLEQYLAGMATQITEDPEAVAKEVVKRILSANDVASVLQPATLLHAEDVLWVPLNVTDVRFNRSDKDGNLSGAYAVITATKMETGEDLTVSCGGTNVMAQLYRLKQLDAFPLPLRLVQAPKPTAQGYYPLWLEAVTPEQHQQMANGEQAF